MAVAMDKLQEFLGRFVTDLDATFAAGNVVTGHLLQAGAKVADIGCGLGASTILLAEQYPNTRFTGSDYHDQSIEIARKRAADAGAADRISFEVASAADFSGTGYDLAATFDCRAGDRCLGRAGGSAQLPLAVRRNMSARRP